MRLYTGGCSCGSIRFALREYLYVLTCHCNACKKRTGSAFGVSVVTENRRITEISGTPHEYTRVAKSGRPVPGEPDSAFRTTLVERTKALREC